MEQRERTDRRRRELQLTARDVELLSFAAEHRLVLGAHVQKLLVLSATAADTRLRELEGAGYLAHRKPFEHEPRCFRITRRGLAIAGSRYSTPRFEFGNYDHDIGMAWVWLAAQNGAFGATREIVSERALRSVDGARADLEPPRGVRLGGYGASGKQRLHYPDLLLITPENRRVAVELELTVKSRARLEKIMGGYAADPKVDAVVYLVDRDSVATAVETAARQFGIGHLVHVQNVRWSDGRRPSAVAEAREQIRSRAGRSADASRGRREAVR